MCDWELPLMDTQGGGWVWIFPRPECLCRIEGWGWWPRLPIGYVFVHVAAAAWARKLHPTHRSTGSFEVGQ